MSPILPVDVGGVDQAQIGFIDQRGGWQGVARFLLTHVATSQPAQFFVYQGSELLQGSRIPISPGHEQPRDFVWRCFAHRNLFELNQMQVMQNYMPKASSHASFPTRFAHLEMKPGKE